MKFMNLIFYFIFVILFLFSCENNSKNNFTEYEYECPFEVDERYENSFQIQIDDKYGLIDVKGNILIKPEYGYLAPFTCGLALFKDKNGLWGYINYTGEIEIEPKYKNANRFHDGFSNIELNGKESYISFNEEYLTNEIFQECYPFREGLGMIQLSNKYGFIDINGIIVIEPVYDNAEFFYEGLSKVEIDGEEMFIDRKGNVAFKVNPEYDWISVFSDGTCIVELDNKYGFLDTSGEVMLEPKYTYVKNFSEGLAPVSTINYEGITVPTNIIHFIDKEGNKVFDKSFCLANAFSEGLANVGIADENGNIRNYFIDTNGEIVFEYDRKYNALDFENGLVKIYYADEINNGQQGLPEYGYMNMEGEIVWEPTN